MHRPARPFTTATDAMLTLRTILVATDFSACAAHAWAHALELARRYDAALHLLHVTVEHVTDLGAAEAAGWAEQAAGLEVVEARRTDQTVPGGIMAYAREHDVDLIVMGTQGRYGVGRFLLGSAAERVVRQALRPVLLVRCPDAEHPAPSGDPGSILVPVDFSAHAHEALRYARALAATFAARVDLLHVVEEPHYPDFYSARRTSIAAIQRDLEREAMQQLRQVYEEVEGPRGPVRFTVLMGHTAQIILTYAAEHQSSLIVMASHGRAGLKEFFMGSVAEKVVRRAPCPVFMVRAFGKSLVRNEAPDAK